MFHLRYIREQFEEYPDTPDYEKHGFISSMAGLTANNLAEMKVSVGLANMMLALTVEDWEVLFNNFSTITVEAISYVAGSQATDELAEMLLAMEYDSENYDEEEHDWEYDDFTSDVFPYLGYENELLFIKKHVPVDGMLVC